MSKRSRKTLTYQITEELQSMLAIGDSKHKDKRDSDGEFTTAVTSEKIYSWGTYHSYKKQLGYFAEFCKSKGCKTLSEARQYASEWLQNDIEKGLSAYTIKLRACSLAKLYRCSVDDFNVSLPSRNRADITRSRGDKVSDKNFSEAKNADLVAFCKGTGLRRSELSQIRGSDLVYKNGVPFLHVTRATKGGRERYAPIVGEIEKIVAMLKSAGDNKVFKSIPQHADIHGYRSEYATTIYKQNARDYETCKADKFIHPKKDSKGNIVVDKTAVYHFRADRKGLWLDKKAMLAASQALGHNRIDVIASHYIIF